MGCSVNLRRTGAFVSAACAKADSVAGATGRKARRGLATTAKRFGKLARTVGKHRVARKLSPDCVAGLRTLLLDLRARDAALR